MPSKVWRFYAVIVSESSRSDGTVEIKSILVHEDNVRPCMLSMLSIVFAPFHSFHSAILLNLGEGLTPPSSEIVAIVKSVGCCDFGLVHKCKCVSTFWKELGNLSSFYWKILCEIETR